MHIYITTLFHHIHFFCSVFWGTLIWDWQLAYLAIGTVVISMVLAPAPVAKTAQLYNHIYNIYIISINKQNNMCKTIQCVKLEMRMKRF